MSSEPSSSLPNTVIFEQRNRKLFAALACAWLGGTAAGVAAALLGAGFWGGAAILWFMVGLVTAPLLWAFNPRATPIRKPLQIDREGLTIGDRRIERDTVLQTSVTTHDGKTRTRLVTGPAKVTSFLTDDEPTARSILRAARLSVQHRVDKIEAHSWALGSQRRALIAFAVTMAIAMVLCAPLLAVSLIAWLGAAAALGPLLSVSWMIAPTILRVGADGIALKWFRHERFIPHADIGRVEEYQNTRGLPTCALVLTSGERVATIAGTNATRLASAVKEAKRSLDDGLSVARSALRRKNSGSLQEWVVHLRSIRQVSSLRRAAVRIEDLWALVEDATAPALERAAAAVTLNAQGDEPTRVRLAEVAEATAMPKLRIALDSTAQDDDALIEALAELEAEPDVQFGQRREHSG